MLVLNILLQLNQNQRTQPHLKVAYQQLLIISLICNTCMPLTYRVKLWIFQTFMVTFRYQLSKQRASIYILDNQITSLIQQLCLRVKSKLEIYIQYNFIRLQNTSSFFAWLYMICQQSVVTIQQVKLKQNKLEVLNRAFIFIVSNEIVLSKFYVTQLTLQYKNLNEFQAFLEIQGKEIYIYDSIFNSVICADCLFLKISYQTSYLCLNNLKFNKFVILGTLLHIIQSQAKLIVINQVDLNQIITNQNIIKIKIEQAINQIVTLNSSFKNIQTNNTVIEISQTQNSLLNFRLVRFISIHSHFESYVLNLDVWDVQMNKVMMVYSETGFLIMNHCNYLEIHSSSFQDIIIDDGLFLIESYKNFTLKNCRFIRINSQSAVINVRDIEFANNRINLNYNYFSLIIAPQVINLNYIYDVKITSTYFINNKCDKYCLLFKPISDYGYKIQLVNNYLINNEARKSLILLIRYQFREKRTDFPLIKNCLFILLSQQLIVETQEDVNQIPIINSYLFGLDQNSNGKYQFINCHKMYDYFLKQKQKSHILILLQIINEKISFQIKNNSKVQNDIAKQYDHFYLPSGQTLDQYQRLEVTSQSYKQYIKQFLIKSDIFQNDEICSLEVKANQEQIKNFTYKIDEDFSHLIKFIIDPYQNQSYHLHLSCQSQKYELIVKVKAFQCQMGEFYSEKQCKLCDITRNLNTIKMNSNKCVYFSEQQVEDMNYGLLKLHETYWRLNHNNHLIEKCDKNCLGGWSVGDQSCHQGYLGALCLECNVYNIRGDGQYSIMQGQCVKCDEGYFRFVSNFLIIFLYQLLQIIITNRTCNQFLESNKQLRLFSKHYIILRKFEVDQISISLRILQDVYFKLVLVKKLWIDMPHLFRIGFNIFPYQIINQGLYCRIYQFGPNILILELICLIAITFFVLSLSLGIMLILLHFRHLKYQISYFSTTIFLSYKQSFRQISYLFISQLLYTKFSGDFYLVGNYQYKYSEYIRITIRMLPIALLQSIIPILMIIRINKQSKYSEYNLNKIWVYFIKDYRKKFQFWELFKLLNQLLFIIIRFVFIQNQNQEIISYVILIVSQQYLQNIDCPYDISNLNNLNRKSHQLVVIILLLLLFLFQSQNYLQYITIFMIILVTQ